MQIPIDQAKLEAAHQYFKSARGLPVEQSVGVNALRAALSKELGYKEDVHWEAKGRLALGEWDAWRQAPQKIIGAVKDACAASGNLLEQRYGAEQGPARPLYQVTDLQQVTGLAERLYGFFLGGAPTPSALAPRFDALAEYLKGNRLSCQWPLFGYLAFLLDRSVYFPIAPEPVKALLAYYGTGASIAGVVSWANYRLVLSFADELKRRLVSTEGIDGPVTPLHMQSYMWIVGGKLRHGGIPPVEDPPPDYEVELAKRCREDRRREAVGLRGELIVYESEKKYLEACGKPELARAVDWVAKTDPGAGYDVRSFDPTGVELHIEVKATTADAHDDPGFWLTEQERQCAKRDGCWRLYRVYGIGQVATICKLGNPIADESPRWRLLPASWHARRSDEATDASSEKHGYPVEAPADSHGAES